MTLPYTIERKLLHRHLDLKREETELDPFYSESNEEFQKLIVDFCLRKPNSSEKIKLSLNISKPDFAKSVEFESAKCVIVYSIFLLRGEDKARKIAENVRNVRCHARYMKDLMKWTQSNAGHHGMGESGPGANEEHCFFKLVS